MFAIHSFPQKEKIKMVKKLFTLLFLVVLALPLSTWVFAQDAPMKMAKEVKWEGTVVRTSPDGDRH